MPQPRPKRNGQWRPPDFMAEYDKWLDGLAEHWTPEYDAFVAWLDLRHPGWRDDEAET